MKTGEVIQGYRIASEPTTSGGGRCVWAFAERRGQPYFIKQFLDPKWPTESSMGSAAGKRLRREECERFESRHRQVNARINPTAVGGGNLVTAIDFFREGTSYYKVTDRVDAISAKDLRGMSLRQTAVVLRTLCHSMRLLHRVGIVHGDLKPANVLLQRSPTGDLYTAKVIDFDDSYPSGEPPPPEEVVGDQRFGAPEWLGYVKRDPAISAEKLTTAADMFALALVIHTYLTGDLPGYDQTRFAAPAEAVWADEPLTLTPGLDPRLVELLQRMTVKDQSRPTVEEVLGLLADETVLSVAGYEPPAIASSSRIRKNFDAPAPTPRGGAESSAGVSTDPARPPGSRVRFNFER